MTSRRLLDEIATVLLNAADHMDRHGHCKGSFYKTGDDPETEPSVCAIGAIFKTTDNGLLRTDAAIRLAEYLGRTTTEVVAWNDAPERTQSEVVAALRESAFTPRKD